MVQSEAVLPFGAVYYITYDTANGLGRDERLMRYVGGEELRGALSYAQAVDALEAAFRSENPELTPQRVNLAVPAGELLQMPAFGVGGVGVKLVTLNPANPARGLPFIQGVYVLFGSDALQPLAILDGAALTGLRTAAVSALATRHLARPDSRRLLVFGAGAQAEAHVEAMAAILPIETVAIAGRSPERAAALAMRLRTRGYTTVLAGPGTLEQADVVCTCTTSEDPLFGADALAPGAHVNAVGSYRVDRRELAPELLRRSMVVVETVAGALEEAGDLVQAIDEGQFAPTEIAGELADVVGGHVRRSSDAQVTVFKSVGLALEDLAIAAAVVQRLGLAAPAAAV